MQAIRAGRGPLTLTALVTLALGGAQLLRRPLAPPPRVAQDKVVHVELRAPRPVTVDRRDVPERPQEIRCCVCAMEKMREEDEARRREAIAKRRAASRSRR